MTVRIRLGPPKGILMAKERKISKEALRAANKKHDARISKAASAYRRTKNGLYYSVYEGREDGSLGTAWSKRRQGKPYNVPKDSF
jgi:hypothetical protein